MVYSNYIKYKHTFVKSLNEYMYNKYNSKYSKSPYISFSNYSDKTKRNLAIKDNNIFQNKYEQYTLKVVRRFYEYL